MVSAVPARHTQDCCSEVVGDARRLGDDLDEPCLGILVTILCRVISENTLAAIWIVSRRMSSCRFILGVASRTASPRNRNG